MLQWSYRPKSRCKLINDFMEITTGIIFVELKLSPLK